MAAALGEAWATAPENGAGLALAQTQPSSPPAVAPAGTESSTQTVSVGEPAAAMVITSVALPVPPALVALIVTLVVAAAVGVPLIKPVVALKLSPAGRPVAP